ncbi:hypothetical protein CHS0354_025604 [Potamilus streckersoni]|uniref:RING-type domain-containing protein n=1 Tax=Potamilus streckersoni TaxID=2493646 RepID=A0AAE0S1G8_9BIVA|nr:hypothetical protein CHS0354_025604 [Potamilus streckersoni]
MMSQSTRLFLLLNTVARLLSGAGIPLKYVCPGHSVHAFQNIKFDSCNADVSLSMNGDRNTQIAKWLIQNCTWKETLLTEYEKRVIFDKNGTITIHNFNHFDQAKYVVISKMTPLPKIYDVQLSLMLAPTKACKPIIDKLGNILIASLNVNDCGKPVAIPYWKDYGGVSNTNEPMLKLPPGKEAGTYYACIDGPALACMKYVQPQNYCSAYTIEGSMQHVTSKSPEVTMETGNTTVIIVISIVMGILFILLVVVTLILIQRNCARRNVNENHTTPLLESNQPMTKSDLKGENIKLSQIDDQRQGLKTHCYNFNSPSDAVQQVLETHKDQEYKTEETINEHQPSIDPAKLRELQELRDDALCKICFSDSKSVCFMPCKHIATCAKCSISLQECPVCRAIIEKKMNIAVD